MPGPRNEFEEHLVELAQGDPGFLADASDLLGYQLEEPRVAVSCPRCGRLLDEAGEDAMVASAAVQDQDVLICHDCEIAEEQDILHGRELVALGGWPVGRGEQPGGSGTKCLVDDPAV